MSGLLRAMGDAFNLTTGSKTSPAAVSQQTPPGATASPQHPEGASPPPLMPATRPTASVTLPQLLLQIARLRSHPPTPASTSTSHASPASASPLLPLLLPEEARQYGLALALGRGAVSERMAVAATVAGDAAEARFWSHLPATLRWGSEVWMEGSCRQPEGCPCMWVHVGAWGCMEMHGDAWHPQPGMQAAPADKNPAAWRQLENNTV